jgi:hypothetical protein
MRNSASTFTAAARSASRAFAARRRGRVPPRRARAAAGGLGVRLVQLREVRDPHEARRVARLLVGLGDDQRHRLLVEVDAVRLERPERLVPLLRGPRRRLFGGRLRAELRRVQVREHPEDARGGGRLPRVDRRDAPLGDGARHDEAVREVRHLELRGVLGPAGHLRHAVDAAHLLPEVPRHQASLPARISARTIARRPSSTLYPLCASGRASASAASAGAAEGCLRRGLAGERRLRLAAAPRLVRDAAEHHARLPDGAAGVQLQRRGHRDEREGVRGAVADLEVVRVPREARPRQLDRDDQLAVLERRVALGASPGRRWRSPIAIVRSAPPGPRTRTAASSA